MVQMDPLNLPKKEEFLGSRGAVGLFLGLEENPTPKI